MLTKEEIIKRRDALADTFSDLPDVFKALCDPIRFDIFRLLMGEVSGYCVTDIAEILGISSPAVSQKLHILFQAGLLDKERMGKEVCFMLKKNNPTVGMIKKMVEKLGEDRE